MSSLETYTRGSVNYTDWKDCQDSDVLLPGLNLLPTEVLGAAYFFALIYLFLGVAIISDIFMEAIETITNQTRTVKRRNPDSGELEDVEERVWNDTVANLTLMALGSSAPEIMLAIVETAANLGKEPGQLGPSTIVGSAAFNLLMITGVCMVSVPPGEIRRITELPVFIVTATFSLWAYAWLAIVYSVWTPDRITIAEALITLAMMPTLVGCAYLADRKPWARRVSAVADEETAGLRQAVPKEEKANGACDGISPSAERPPQANLEQRRESADGGAQKHSRAHYRLNAGHAMTGQSHLKRVQISPDAQPADGIKQRHLSLGDSPSFVLPASFNGLREPDAPEVGFKSIKYAVLESCGQVELTVTRLGNHANFSKECRIEYKTVEGTAKPESDYVHTQGTLILKPNQTEAKISVEIVDDDINETDEEFYVELFDPKQCMVRKNVSRATVVIIDDDNPGMLMFSQHEYKYGPAQTQVTMNVKRVKGADGAITCVYETVNGSAEADIHYEHTKGTLSFEHGETQKSITVNLLRKEEFKNGDVFHVQLSEVTGGAQLIRNGMTDVVSDETAPVDRGPSRMLRALTRGRTFEFQFGASTWGQQIRDSLSAGGATDIFGVQEEPSMADLLLHFVSAGWKLLFALIVPPASYGGGKPTFVVAILAIAGLTYVVGEFASLFGCIVGVPDMVTAISFVALGTSLPDTFASRLATLEADDADAAIGNVTGSNSVNVFLGLGLPWLLGSVYSYLKDEHYHSPAGSLVFSVIVYSVMAVACIALLMARRVFVGGELGGKGAGPAAMACCSMWVIYLVVSGLQATGKVDDPFT